MVIFSFQNHQLKLPSPRLDDSESLVLNVHIDRAMNGKFYAFKKQSKVQQRLSMFFEHVNRPLILEVIAFLKVSAGQQIKYIDYDNVIWVGKLLTMPFSETHRNIRDNQFNLEFEGTHG